MIRPCPTCDGSGIDYQDTCVQCERPWGPGEPCGPESYAMPKPCPCPTCVDMPRLKCVWELCKHGFAYNCPRFIDAEIMPERCPGGREIVLREATFEDAMLAKPGTVYVVVEEA